MTSTALSFFGDPATFATALNALGDVAVVTPARGPFRAQLTSIALPRLSLLAAEERQARVAFVAPPAGRVVIMLPTNNSDPSVWNSAPRQDHELITIGARARPHWWTRGAARWMAVCLSAEVLVASGRILEGAGFHVPQDLRRWRPPHRELRALVRLCGAAIRLAETHPAMPLDAGASRGLEQEVLEMLIECLSAGQPEPDPPARQREVALMERVEGLLREPASRHANANALFAALGCSELALRACFRAHLGIGPRQYIRLRRADAQSDGRACWQAR